MTHVVQVTTAHPATDNRITRKECRALREAGYDVTLVAVADSDETQGAITPGVRALPRGSSRLRRMVVGPWRALGRVALLRPDVVHGHDPELIPALAVYSVVSRLVGHRTIVIYDAHESLPEQVVGKAYLSPLTRPFLVAAARALERLAARTMSAVVAATPRIADAYDGARVCLVQNYPWLTDFPDAVPYAAALETPPTFVYAGGINRGRGSAVMGRLARALIGEATLTIAGPSDSEGARDLDGPGIEYLGTLPPAAVPAVIASARAGLSVLLPLPNYVESQPTKMYEYMAAGRPFIASDFPAWRSLFGPFDCGLFVDPTDDAAVERAARTILSDPDGAAQMGERGRQAILDHFSFDREGARLAALYDELIAEESQ